MNLIQLLKVLPSWMTGKNSIVRGNVDPRYVPIYHKEAFHNHYYSMSLPVDEDANQTQPINAFPLSPLLNYAVPLGSLQ